MQHQNLTFPTGGETNPTNFTTYTIPPEKAHDISERLQQFMCKEKPFLRYRYSIKTLADDIQVQAYQLSAYLNQEKRLRFNDYLNRFRIEYCENLIQEGLVKDLNMRGLALICGFQNRNTLTSAFKKFTGLTPSRYTKSVRLGILH
ncbi:MAG TPA: AraC family transcriptional regulator [Niastella sp.]